VFLSIDGTLLVQVVNFILFIVLLNAVFLRPVGRAIAERRAYIDGLARDIESGEAEVRSARGRAEEQRAAARRDAEAAIAKARVAAQTEAGDVTGEYQRRALGIVEDAQRQVGTEIDAARANEAQIVDGLARTMLERAIGPGAAA
jgi:F-type H+-transporting ATPase subunit b